MLKYTEDAHNCAYVESGHIKGYLVHDEGKTWWALFESARAYYQGAASIKTFEHDGSTGFEELVVDRWLEYGDFPILFDSTIEQCATKTGTLAQDSEGCWTWTCDQTGSDIVSSNRTWLIKTLRAIGEIK